MGYTNIIATMEWGGPHTKKLKYCSSAKFDEHSNEFGKQLSPGPSLMTGTNISALPKIKLTTQTIPSSNMTYLRQK